MDDIYSWDIDLLMISRSLYTDVVRRNHRVLICRKSDFYDIKLYSYLCKVR